MIRDAVIHLLNEQPLLADLFERPAAVDNGLLCTNLRTMSGKRPVWIDDMRSIFFFPFTVLRFIEIPVGSEGAPGLPPGAMEATERPAGGTVAPEDDEADLEIDEEFLKRVRDV